VQLLPTTPPLPDAGPEYAVPLDFTLGIHSRYPSTPGHDSLTDGAAAVANTYGCYALADGSLGPLPARSPGTAQTELPYDKTGHTPSTTYKPANKTGAYITDALVQSPMFADAVTNRGFSDNPDGVFVLWDFNYRSAGGAGTSYQQYALGRFYKVFNTGAIDFQFMLGAQTFDSSLDAWIGSHTLLRTRSTDAAHSPPYAPAVLLPVIAHLVSMRGGVSAGAAISADDQALTSYETDLTVGATSPTAVCSVFPHPTTAVRSSAQNLDVEFTFQTGDAYLLVGHQDRVVAFGLYESNFGDSSTAVFADTIGYTGPLNVTRTDSPGGAGALAYLAENPTLVGAAASLTADELFIVKHYGGAVLIRGSLDVPTIHRLPMVESTYGITCHPVVTPIGVVYGTRNGIFVYAGGDNAQRLSTQLDGFFWDHRLDPDNERYYGNRGRFGYWNGFVCVPNNYLFDTRTGAWWRLEADWGTSALAEAASGSWSLEDGSGDWLLEGSTTDTWLLDSIAAAASLDVMPYNCYDVSAYTGKLYAFHYKTLDQIGGAGDEWGYAWSTYSWDTLRSSYAWESQPLLVTRDNRITARGVELVALCDPDATGSSVTVTVTAHTEDGTRVTGSATFALTESGRVNYLRADLIPTISGTPLQGRHLTVRFDASSTVGAAPRIMPGTRLLVGEGQRAPKAA
jgi:hypothetical protein